MGTEIKVIFGKTTCLRSSVLIIVYLIVISSILPKYTWSALISTISQSLNSLVYSIMIPAIIFPRISLKANQTPNEIPHRMSPTLNPTISNPTKNEKMTKI